MQSAIVTGPEAVTAASGRVPAWLHVVVFGVLALVALVFVGILAVTHSPIPTPLVVFGTFFAGTAAGVASPATLLR